MRRCLPLLLLPMALPMGGCIARAAVDAVTLPVRAVSGGVDALTTSQSEADEKRGRALREQEEEWGRLARQRDRAARDCTRGDDRACADMRAIDREMERLREQPYED